MWGNIAIALKRRHDDLFEKTSFISYSDVFCVRILCDVLTVTLI